MHAHRPTVQRRIDLPVVRSEIIVAVTSNSHSYRGMNNIILSTLSLTTLSREAVVRSRPAAGLSRDMPSPTRSTLRTRAHTQTYTIAHKYAHTHGRPHGSHPPS